MPVITTSVPTCPDDGSTDVISPAVMYVKPSSLVDVAPVSAITTTSTTPAARAPIFTFTSVSLSDVTDVASTPPNDADVTSAPPPRSVVPPMVTSVPTWPESGVTVSTAPAVTYVKPLVLVTVAPVSAISTTSPAPRSELAPAATVTLVSVSSVTRAT